MFHTLSYIRTMNNPFKCENIWEELIFCYQMNLLDMAHAFMLD